MLYHAQVMAAFYQKEGLWCVHTVGYSSEGLPLSSDAGVGLSFSGFSVKTAQNGAITIINDRHDMFALNVQVCRGAITSYIENR